MKKALLEIIKKEIQKKGPIPFDRFMNICLYHPKLGYYNQPNVSRQGKKGDYFTSVSVGKTFSLLLTFTFIKMLKKIKPKQLLTLVELGAGDGTLAFDILSTFKKNYPKTYEQIFYVAVEKNKWHRSSIKEKAKINKEDRIEAKRSLKELNQIENGIVFANELIDSLPVKQFKISSSGLLELYIKLKKDKLLTCFKPVKNTFLLKQLKQAKIDSGKVFEVNYSAQRLLKELSTKLNSGYLLLFDYGGLQEEIISRSPEGTLRGFHHHKLVTNLTFRPGETDLTSDVNFTDLICWAEKLGFITESYQTQLEFFSSIFEKLQKNNSIENELNPNELKILIHPDFMGERFKVLTLKR